MDYLVIGAGPVGLQLGWFLHGAGRDYSILEAGRTPGAIRAFPRHRRMISINKRRLTDSATAHDLNVAHGTRAVRVARESRGGQFVVTDQHGQTYRTERVIVATGTRTGFRMDTDIFDETCRPKPTINGRFPALTSEWESVNVPDLYFAGTPTQLRDLERDTSKEDTSPSIHGIRYGGRVLQRMLDRKYEGIEWPHRVIPADPAVMTSTVLNRINRSSALVQQYAFLCDLIVVEPDGATARYYEELLVDYVQDSVFGADSRYFMITLEYGDGHDAIDPLDVEAGREWEADSAHDDRYLHPVVRHYGLWKPISVRRLPEDVCDDWTGEADYRLPLCDFFTRQMALAPA